MNEETDVKAPVTRLRRRLSVEQSEDGKLSPALGTPTKKRGVRKVAKTELELIDENVTENNLKKTTKKNIAKEVAESVEDRPITPSRRSARIKSNTSIVSETVQSVDSPRAKRAAARRTSQVGSDSEVPLTPVRQTRRTRKDSTSSIEKEVDAVPAVSKAQIPEIITEEPDNVTQSTNDGSKTSDTENTTQTPIRKSPRLLKNKSRSSTTLDDNKNDNFETNNTEFNQSNTSLNIIPTWTNTHIKNDTEKTHSKNKRLSVSSSNLIMNLEDKPKKINSHINKSLSEAQDLNKIKSKRNRTKSWTTITNVSLANDDFYSDNEVTKKKHQGKLDNVIRNKPFNFGSGDSANIHDLNEENISITQNRSITSSGKKKKKDSTPKNIQNDSEITNLFQNEPSGNIQTTIVMEDLDSNPQQGNLLKDDIDGDQCVPVVDHQLENKENNSPDYTLSTSLNKNKNDSIISQSVKANNTCEPMDVDETLSENLPNNISIKEFENQEKLLLHNSLETDISMVTKNSNISKRKSSSSLSTSQNLEKSNTENKSTLKISELKDLSNAENKSPKISNKEQLSQSNTVLNITQENDKRKKLSLNYLTSTPLQQKTGSDNHGDKTTSTIFDNNSSKNKNNITPKQNVSEIVKRSASTAEQSSEADSESEVESESDKSENLLDDAADEVNDDYESGDSRDEDEKQYEKDNEIVETGETLTSDEEQSNDSDYEKDSFLVSSDDEDNELLSGSGDDLSMSDNELKMNPASKKKYNDRKIKEQKKASKEMYESRHKINTSKKSNSKSSRDTSHERLDSSKSEDVVMGTKKNKRMRLNSTASESINKSNIEDRDSSNNYMDLSESSYNENFLKEKEITASEQTIQNIEDPLAPNVKEENTSVNERNVSIGFVDTEIHKTTPSKSNQSISTCLKPKDPLEDSDNDDSSSLSTEDESIAQNYNDMLNDLKVKTANHSLNAEKKTKIKSSVPIVDHLNITQTKTVKASNKSSQKESNFNSADDEQSKKLIEISVTNYINQTVDQTAELKQELNEDSSGVHKNKNVKKSKFLDLSLNLDKKAKNPIDKPLLLDELNLTQSKKKSKTGKSEKVKSKLENLNHDDSSDSIDLKLLFSEDSINSSDNNKENMKKTESDIDDFIPLKKVEAKTDIRGVENLVNNDNTDVPFFIDTTGKQSSTDEETEKQENTKNKTQKREESSDDDSNDEPLEISFKKEQNNKFVKKNKENIDVDEIDNVNESMANKSLPKTPKSDKKEKKSLSKNLSQIENDSEKSLHEITINKDIKRKSSMASLNLSNLEDLFSAENISQNEHNKSISTTPGIEKKKRLSQLNVSEIKHNNSTEVEHNKSISKTPNSEKKKNKKLSESLNMSKDEITENKISIESMDKQNSKMKKKCLSRSNDVDSAEATTDQDKTIEKTPASEGENANNALPKKRKRSTEPSFVVTLEDDSSKTSVMAANESILSEKKKRKLSQMSEDNNAQDEKTTNDIELNKNATSAKQKKNRYQVSDSNNICKESIEGISRVKEIMRHGDDEPVNSKTKINKNKKRKIRDDDIDANKALKVRKDNLFDRIHITRLPSSVLNELDDKPNKDKILTKKHNVVSTTEFVVEETRKRTNKPSNYLEDSIYINEDDILEEKKKKPLIKKPKVLPFIPTATTSNSGYTSNFKVNVIPQEIKFVAQSNNINSFKNEYLYSKKIKRLGTYDLYKRNRNIKMSKF